MFGYFLNRWIMTRRFEQVEARYVYRRRPDLPGIALSAEERQATLRAFRRRYWRHILLLYGGLIALAAAAALALQSWALTIVSPCPSATRWQRC
ncbi:hypothetical protein PK98_15270 [Croceibacterium mercuriale]|uniref:Uncharacterized protein n=1 Tax=Croceibacterium mercuriale TaxID=1572751 RepID=A0A0B2BRY1_9SPHN|nr:hypothetical protein [Croceibacterium mercuriale]KHL24136.1 hypothetical protein PK98_15270 [Croceibacterium mercuriale]